MLAGVAILIAASAARPARDHDPVTQDPIARDPDFPAGMVESPAGLSVDGQRLNGIVYLAAGRGPHPTVVLLHGLPGNERNTDLAHALRRGGWNVAFFHYRGAWGSEGNFSFVNAVEDAEAMIAYLKQEAPARSLRVDSKRIVLVGHSLGGGVALIAGARSPGVCGVVSIAGADLGLLGELEGEARTGMGRHLEGALALRVPSGEAVFEQMASTAIEMHVPEVATGLATRPLLLITGSHDEVVDTETHQGPLVTALEEAEAEQLTRVVLAADHGFSSRRIELARTILTWIDEHCR